MKRDPTPQEIAELDAIVEMILADAEPEYMVTGNSELTCEMDEIDLPLMDDITK